MISYLPQADVVRRNSRNDHATRFSDLMLPYVRANLLPHKNAIEYEVFKTNLARHTECLKFVSNSQLRWNYGSYQFNDQFTFSFVRMADHINILKYFKDNYNDKSKKNCGVMFAGYNLLLENSPHLENQWANERIHDF